MSHFPESMASLATNYNSDLQTQGGFGAHIRPILFALHVLHVHGLFFCSDYVVCLLQPSATTQGLVSAAGEDGQNVLVQEVDHDV